jgi:CIC family chloride channel protein
VIAPRFIFFYHGGQAITEDVDFISKNANITHLLQLFRFAKDIFYFPVVNHTDRMVVSICSRNVIKLTPDDNICDAMHLFNLKWIEDIPVVESRKDHWGLGMLRRREVVAASNHEVLKRGISEKEETFRVLRSTS